MRLEEALKILDIMGYDLNEEKTIVLFMDMGHQTKIFFRGNTESALVNLSSVLLKQKIASVKYGIARRYYFHIDLTEMFTFEG